MLVRQFVHWGAAAGNVLLLASFLWRWWRWRSVVMAVMLPEMVSVAAAVLQEWESRWGQTAAFRWHYAAFDTVQGACMLMVAIGASRETGAELHWRRSVAGCYMLFVIVLISEYAMAEFWFGLRGLANKLFWWREGLDVANAWLLAIAVMLRPSTRAGTGLSSRGDVAYGIDCGTEGTA